ncbi:MAG: hypothetical protein ACP5I3_09625 [Thermoproteus sp.]
MRWMVLTTTWEKPTSLFLSLSMIVSIYKLERINALKVSIEDWPGKIGKPIRTVAEYIYKIELAEERFEEAEQDMVIDVSTKRTEESVFTIKKAEAKLYIGSFINWFLLTNYSKKEEIDVDLLVKLKNTAYVV